MSSYNVEAWMVTRDSELLRIVEMRKAQRRTALKWDSGRTSEDALGSQFDQEA